MSFNVFFQKLDIYRNSEVYDYDFFYYFKLGYVAVPIKEKTTLIPITFGICRYMERYYYEYQPNFKGNRKNTRPYFGIDMGLEFEFKYDDISIKKTHLTFAPVLGFSKLFTDKTSLEANVFLKGSTSGIYTFGVNLGVGFLH